MREPQIQIEIPRYSAVDGMSKLYYAGHQEPTSPVDAGISYAPQRTSSIFTGDKPISEHEYMEHEGQDAIIAPALDFVRLDASSKLLDEIMPSNKVVSTPSKLGETQARSLLPSLQQPPAKLEITGGSSDAIEGRLFQATDSEHPQQLAQRISELEREIHDELYHGRHVPTVQQQHTTTLVRGSHQPDTKLANPPSKSSGKLRCPLYFWEGSQPCPTLHNYFRDVM